MVNDRYMDALSGNSGASQVKVKDHDLLCLVLMGKRCLNQSLVVF